MFELKELFPHWPLSEFAKQLNYDGYKTAQGNCVLHDLFKQLAIRQLVVTKKTKQPRNIYLLNYYEQKMKMVSQSVRQSYA